ncbi:MAG: nitrilase-related carbon-nitrogen hydrolase, partial [Hyphomicrobiales bacterium]
MAADAFRIALAQYPIGRPASFEEYAANLGQWVSRAAAEGAELLVFPEYGSMELASLFGPEVEAGLDRQIAEVAGLESRVDELHSALARESGVYILAASIPARTAAGHVNRARLFGPRGGVGRQDKTVMTRFENEEWSVMPGAGL